MTEEIEQKKSQLRKEIYDTSFEIQQCVHFYEQNIKLLIGKLTQKINFLNHIDK